MNNTPFTTLLVRYLCMARIADDVVQILSKQIELGA